MAMHFRQFVADSGWKQQEVADFLRVSRSYVAEILSGRKRPSLALALRIERLTGGAVPVQSWADQDDTEDAA